MSRTETRPSEPLITIVLPAINEAQNLEVILPRLPEVHEIILVDGHSVDDTIETAQRVRPDIKVVQQTRRGKGNALACGFEYATGDIIVMFDADGSAEPREIDGFVHALTSGADFAKGSRFCVGGGSDDITAFRRLGNYFLNVLANTVLHARYTDLCYGYNAFWTDILEHIDLPSTSISAIDNTAMLWGDGFEIETIINCRIAAANLTVVEVPSHEKLRIHGVSNLNAVTDGLRVLKTIGAERQRAQRVLAERRHLEIGGREHLVAVTGDVDPYLSIELARRPEIGEGVA
ncbi:MAG: glycosyltransferase family 2 protein [Actinomycetota bacterium]|nr:glycosyltransferase family 2 protein [Actinomycetota bacterium]